MYASGKESKAVMKAFKYRLYPTPKQRETLQFTLDRNRELYNAALEERREAWRMKRVSVTYEMQSAQLPQIKEDRPELNEIYSQVLQDTLKRVDKAFNRLPRRIKKSATRGGASIISRLVFWSIPSKPSCLKTSRCIIC